MGHKVHIMVEECALPYRVHPSTSAPATSSRREFLAISPNTDSRDRRFRWPGQPPHFAVRIGRDPDLPGGQNGPAAAADLRDRYVALQWLMFQVGHIGPMLGQAHHFRQYAPERIEYAVDRYTREATRLYGVMDRRLAEAAYFAGAYSIADIAIFPWTRSHQNQGVDLAQFPNVQRWFKDVSNRPAVQRGLDVLKEHRKSLLDARSRENLFGGDPDRAPLACPVAR